MSFNAITDLGPPRIHSVVAARSAAVKIRQLSSSLFADRKKKLDLYDHGDFAVTFSDDPANPQESVIKPKQEERQRRRRSTAITPISTRGLAEQSVTSPDSNKNNLLEPRDASQRRRSSATFSSGFSDPLTDTVENASRQGDASPRQRRRQSTVVSRLPTTTSTEHNRFAEQESRNTYCLEPDRKFEHWKVTVIIKKIFEEHLREGSYDEEFCNRMSKTLADLIKEQVKSLQFSRYKIICIVSIGQKRGQSVRMVSRSVWDPRFDGYAQYSYEKGDMYAIGVVYAIYYE